MSHAFSFALPVLPVAVNNAYNTQVHDGKPLRFASREVTAFKRWVHIVATWAAAEAGWQYQAGDRLAVEVVLCVTNNWRSDIDGRLKTLIDGLAEACGFDDACIDVIFIRRIRQTVEATYVHLVTMRRPQDVRPIWAAMTTRLPAHDAVILAEAAALKARRAAARAKKKTALQAAQTAVVTPKDVLTPNAPPRARRVPVNNFCHTGSSSRRGLRWGDE